MWMVWNVEENSMTLTNLSNYYLISIYIEKNISNNHSYKQV